MHMDPVRATLGENGVYIRLWRRTTRHIRDIKERFDLPTGPHHALVRRPHVCRNEVTMHLTATVEIARMLYIHKSALLLP